MYAPANHFAVITWAAVVVGPSLSAETICNALGKKNAVISKKTFLGHELYHVAYLLYYSLLCVKNFTHNFL